MVAAILNELLDIFTVVFSSLYRQIHSRSAHNLHLCGGSTEAPPPVGGSGGSPGTTGRHRCNTQDTGTGGVPVG